MDFLLKEFKVIIFMYSIIQGYAQSMRLPIGLYEFISVYIDMSELSLCVVKQNVDALC